ncbi:MFS transporter [Nocardia sp. CDC159]|uniref:MFS transporter n=1 Tax=Nocardia pulmonis TaxID=2951408 RepID=A0A9X2J1G9_9NOCA|nr:MULTISPECIES: MFS transporter [Nocardia]MCM6776996.1 MFS transporter [Nocardia pulmonis]MCM6789420.1 MFS transporter [Nocardia sp. CDC159]
MTQEQRATRRAAATAVLRSPGMLRLALVRFAGQFGDGMFQAALSGAILFNPERATDPLAIAAGFTVLLLPYSVIGPYAGALLDRWDRRMVLLVANVLRALLILIAAAGLLGGIRDTPLLLLALAVVGISRFVLAGVSAALPRVLAQRWLVPMNSVLATAASACAGVGAAISVAIIGAIGAGDFASAVAVAVSASGSLVGGVAAAGFTARRLGPEPGEGAPTSSVRAILTGLRTGARAVWSSRECTTAMIGIGTHRIVFGANTLLMVLVLRRAQADGVSLNSGLVGFGVAITAVASGMLAAAVLAPLLIPRLGRPRTVVAGLATAIAVQLVLVTPITVTTGAAEGRAHHLLLVGAFLLGLAGQTIKLTGDATMQIDIDDSRRGQVFALQDTVFNITFVLAIAVTALVIPIDGRSFGVVLAGAVIYGLGIVAIAANTRRHTLIH